MEYKREDVIKLGKEKVEGSKHAYKILAIVFLVLSVLMPLLAVFVCLYLDYLQNFEEMRNNILAYVLTTLFMFGLFFPAALIFRIKLKENNYDYLYIGCMVIEGRAKRCISQINSKEKASAIRFANKYKANITYRVFRPKFNGQTLYNLFKSNDVVDYYDTSLKSDEFTTRTARYKDKKQSQNDDFDDILPYIMDDDD